jgi:single-strand DNA-binding protein
MTATQHTQSPAPPEIVQINRAELMGTVFYDNDSVTLVGRAADSPEVRYFESGSVCANVQMLITRKHEDDVTPFALELWGKQARTAADYIRKGTLFGVIGSFKLQRWTDTTTGEQRTKHVVRVDRLELLEA